MSLHLDSRCEGTGFGCCLEWMDKLSFSGRSRSSRGAPVLQRVSTGLLSKWSFGDNDTAAELAAVGYELWSAQS